MVSSNPTLGWNIYSHVILSRTTGHVQHIHESIHPSSIHSTIHPSIQLSTFNYRVMETLQMISERIGPSMDWVPYHQGQRFTMGSLETSCLGLQEDNREASENPQEHGKLSMFTTGVGNSTLKHLLLHHATLLTIYSLNIISHQRSPVQSHPYIQPD